ncbi:MAG: siroheme synthase [Acidobacteria bacterium]|nr:MAG: siroheme synthase [Acidobacteriota bacterium]
MSLFPIFLKLKSGRECLVVGAGAVAESKIESLIVAESKILVVAPEAGSKVNVWARSGVIRWEPRKFQRSDLENMFLVIAATSSRDVNRQVFEEAQSRNILCNAVDDPEYCDFYYPAVVRRGDLQIAISTAGHSPALAQRLRRQFEKDFGPEYGDWLQHLGSIRKSLFAREIDPVERRRVLHEIAAGSPAHVEAVKVERENFQ